MKPTYIYALLGIAIVFFAWKWNEDEKILKELKAGTLKVEDLE